MRRLKRLTRLTSNERRLLLRALFVVAVARVTLRVLPWTSARRVVTAVTGVTEEMSVERLVWAVKVASGVVPRATCLTQALALQALLARSGHESRLEIGVAKDSAHRFEAHAWVICGDEIVIGGPDVTRYVPLMAWKL